MKEHDFVCKLILIKSSAKNPFILDKPYNKSHPLNIM